MPFLMLLVDTKINYIGGDSLTKTPPTWRKRAAWSMPKRKLTPKKQGQLDRCLQVPGASERAVHEIWNICREDDGANISRRTFMDTVQSVLGPWKDCSFEQAFECHDGTMVNLPLMQLQPLVETVCEQSLAFTNALKQSFEKNKFLTPIIYCDECTAGNVLSVDKARKACLFYMTWVETWHYLKNQSMWLPIAAIQSDCLNLLQGGPSAVVVAILTNLWTVENEHSFGISCRGLNFTFRQKQKGLLIADNEGIRAVYSSKGSSGIRPCLHCSNVVKRDTNISRFDDFFVEVSAWQGFQPVTDEEIFQMADSMQHCATKAELEMTEKCAGFSFVPNSLLFTEQRWKLGPSRILTDYMHTYLANGIASWEIALFVQTIVDHTSITLDMLRTCALGAGWKGTRSSGKTANYLGRLFDSRMFGEGLYKGQAHHTLALAFLLRYYGETTIDPSGQVPKKFFDSFGVLCDILSHVRSLQNRTVRLEPDETNRLQTLQERHQQEFGRAYGGQYYKPKHHHRFHLASNFLFTGCVVTCEPMESKHMIYKSGVADRQKHNIYEHALFSASVLHRLVKAWVDNLKKNGLPFWELLPPTRKATVDDQIIFATNDVQESASCYLLSCKIMAGDILCWDAYGGLIETWFSCPSTLAVRCQKMDLVSRPWFRKGTDRTIPQDLFPKMCLIC